MNPRAIDEMGWEMGQVYASVTDRILINLARHFKRVTEGNKPGGGWDYQIRMLAQMGQVRSETVEILVDSLAGEDAALQEMLVGAIYDSLEKVEPELEEAAEAGLLPGGSAVRPELSPNQMQAFKSFYRQSADKMNLVNTTMLQSTQDIYQQTVADIANKMEAAQTILNAEAGEVVAGVTTMNQAIRDGVQKMVDKGITGFIDSGGHRWTPEAYINMDVRTTLANTGRAAVWEAMEGYGDDLYMVSYHDGARPLCYPWQGKVISRSDWAGEVEDGNGNKVQVYRQSDTSYGEPAGLFGINCGHYPMPFIPGMSYVRKPTQNEEENAKDYEETQQQRALERKLREEKRDYEVLKAQGAPEEELKAQRERVRNANADLNDFCDETGRSRRSGRERTPSDAKWPTDNGEVRRFNGQYVGTDQPLHVNVPSVAPVPDVPSVPVAPVEGVTDPWVVHSLPHRGMEAIPPRKMLRKPTQKQIVEKVGGGDKTGGSCSSAAFAYAGNEGGYDVRDFRGGESRSIFARDMNIEQICKFPGVDGKWIYSKNDLKAAHDLMSQMEEGKQYYFAVGRHAAIVRRTKTGFEFLELQSEKDNGFHPLTDKELRYRFGCRKKAGQHSMGGFLIDVAKLAKSPDFIEMLKYINTPAGKQMKGVGGSVR